MKKKKYSYVKWILAAIIVVVASLSVTVFVQQNKRLALRKQEREDLIREKQEKELERERLRLLDQYVGTEEYVEYYARYRMGYMGSDEIRFEK